MKRLIRQSENKTGFTIVELLTVMSIIVILIGLLVPALNAARRYASDVKQKAQFHSIDAALELFKNDFGDYPDSATLSATVATGLDEAGQPYPGAARLCEAMVGQDLLGFYPGSHFRADCTIDGTIPAYSTASSWATLSPADVATNLQSRKGPYLPLDKANAYKLSDIYGSTAVTAPLTNDFVLCDEYARVKNATTGKRIGVPILYYKANTLGTRHDANFPPAAGPPPDSKGQFYNYLDNDYLVQLPMPWNPSATNPLNSTPPGAVFYGDSYIRNLNIPGNVSRPYRSDSYILISAGYDGLYGTVDDVFNFEKQ
jgi:type II secretory pathway pseudopilin PulG